MEIQFGSDGVPFVTWGDNKIMLELNPIDDEVSKEKAKTELRETPEVVEQALIELRQLLKSKLTKLLYLYFIYIIYALFTFCLHLIKIIIDFRNVILSVDMITYHVDYCLSMFVFSCLLLT